MNAVNEHTSAESEDPRPESPPRHEERERIRRTGGGTDRCERVLYLIRAGSANARCVDQTLTIQSLRLLVFMTGLGTTGILIPRSLNASRMRAAWIASTHAMPASRSTR
jgi:hypothetical protein